MEFEQIVHTYQEPLYWHLRRLVVSHEDAEDLLQDVFLQAYRSLGQLRDAQALRAWLYRIATNAAYRHLRRHLKQPLLTEEISELLLARLASDNYVDYEQGVGVRFQRALLTLSEQQRAVFTMRYYDEMPYDEIAAVVGSNEASLRVSYSNACSKIKAYLKNND